MANSLWRYTLLQVSDLPTKAQRFIELMELDVSNFKFVLLESDPHGGYIINTHNEAAIYKRYDNTIYFLKRMQVGTVIHELTHYYLDNSDHDTKAISEKFISLYGEDALTNYATVSMLEAKGKIKSQNESKVESRYDRESLPDNFFTDLREHIWDEVVCEIVATYGRRGQFDKIKELFA